MIFIFIEDMKLKNIYTTLCLSALAVVSCSKDETVLPGRTATGEPFAITVTDGGYANADAPATRAVENGYTTEFTQGDACGLYIVRNGNIVESNLMLIAETSSSTGGELAWKVRDSESNDVDLYYNADCRYFVYYPYQTDMTDKVNASASDEASFFAPLINGWQPLSDQSDYKTGYTASDLMTAIGSVGTKNADGKRPLTFFLTHRMALVVIEMPKTVYKFADAGIPDYTVQSEATFTGTAKPLRMADGTYRYLLPTSLPTSLPTIEGSYDEGNRGVTITPSYPVIQNGYKIYKVDGAATIQKDYHLQVGDFFLADGRVLPKDAEASVVQAADVVGIVFQTDKSRIGAKEKEKLGGEDKVHGLVMSVKNAKKDLQWGPYRIDEGLTKCVTKADNYNDISGYGNCEHIRTNRKGFDSYPAFKAADNYNTTCPVPATTTGWYLPASGQWWDILQNLGGCPALARQDEQTSMQSGDFTWSGQGNVSATLNVWMEKIAADSKNDFNGSPRLWSSSEYSGSYARFWLVGSDGDVCCHWVYKNNYGTVRPVLAF